MALQKIKYLEGILPYTSPDRYEEVRNEIIGLSKNGSVPSSLTALVTVHTRSAPVPVPVTTRMVQVTVPGAGTVQHTHPDPVSSEYGPPDEDGTLTQRHTSDTGKKPASQRSLFAGQRGRPADKAGDNRPCTYGLHGGKRKHKNVSGTTAKIARYLAERITNGGITLELSRNSEALLKTILALKLCLANNILNDTTREWVMQCMDDIRAASQAPISLLDCRDEILELLDKGEWKKKDTIKRIAAVDEDTGTLLDRIGLSAEEGLAIPALAKLAICQAVTS